MLSSHLICSRLLCLLPSIFPRIRDFSNESSVHIRWPKYWSFSFTISSSGEYSGLISLKIETGLISLLSKGLSGVLSSTTVLYVNDSQIRVFIQDLSTEHNTIPSVTRLADGGSSGYLRSLSKSAYTNQNSSLLSHPQIHCLEPPFVVNSSHPLNCLGQRLSRHTDYSTFMPHICQTVFFMYKMHPN